MGVGSVASCRLVRWIAVAVVSAASFASDANASLAAASDLMIERGAPAPPYLAQPEFLTFSAARWKRDTIRWYYNPAYSPIAASTVVAVAQASFAKWSAVCNVSFAYGGITATPPHATDGLVVIGWSTVLGSSSGGTWIEIVADRIVDADIGLHPQQAGGVAPLDSLLVHEIGHVLGLDHSDVPGAVMSGPPYTPYVSWPRCAR